MSAWCSCSCDYGGRGAGVLGADGSVRRRVLVTSPAGRTLGLGGPDFQAHHDLSAPVFPLLQKAPLPAVGWGAPASWSPQTAGRLAPQPIPSAAHVSKKGAPASGHVARSLQSWVVGTALPAVRGPTALGGVLALLAPLCRCLVPLEHPALWARALLTRCTGDCTTPTTDPSRARLPGVNQTSSSMPPVPSGKKRG